MAFNLGLKIFPLTSELFRILTDRAKDYETSTDSGFDLVCPDDVLIPARATILVDLKVKCEPLFESGYYVYPRSSIGKTPLRMSNSVGIIDQEYRGNIKVWVSNQSSEDFQIKKGDRYFQLCHPTLIPMKVKVVENENEINTETKRGEGGFGSTGVN